MRQFIAVPSLFSLILVLAPAFAADKGQKRPGAAADSGRAAAWRKALESGESEQIIGALGEIAVAKDASAAAAVEALLARGADAKVLVRACQVLGQLSQPRSSPAIAPYVRHRLSEVRQAAVLSLAQTKGPSAVEALRAGLHSSDTAVRGLSATGLGNLGAREAVPDLFAVLPKGVLPAAHAIGRLCGGEECDRLLGQLGKIPFDTIKPGLDAMLFRSAAEVPDDLKVKVIERVRGLLTDSAAEFLKDVQSRWPSSGSAKVRSALIAALDARRGAQ